nr:hypothetical protein [Tanacetum cinerariifolium]
PENLLFYAAPIALGLPPWPADAPADEPRLDLFFSRLNAALQVWNGAFPQVRDEGRDLLRCTSPEPDQDLDRVLALVANRPPQLWRDVDVAAFPSHAVPFGNALQALTTGPAPVAARPATKAQRKEVDRKPMSDTPTVPAPMRVVFEMLIKRRPVSVQAKASNLQAWIEEVRRQAKKQWHRTAPLADEAFTLTLPPSPYQRHAQLCWPAGYPSHRHQKPERVCLPASTGWLCPPKCSPMNAAQGSTVLSAYFAELVSTYQQRGYQVYTKPGEIAAHIPFDLGDYRPDLLMEKGEEHLLITIRNEQAPLSIDRFQRITLQVRQHPGWHFRIATPSFQHPTQLLGVADELLSWNAAQQQADTAQLLLTQGQPQAALLVAWAGLEALLRRHAEQVALPIDRQSSITLLKYLYSQGEISIPQYDQALELSALRNQLAHGYQPTQPVEPAAPISVNLPNYTGPLHPEGQKVRHILCLSGGKDSTALALYMRDKVPEMEYAFADTGEELPETYEYLALLESYLDRKIVRLNPDRLFQHHLDIRNGFLPSGRQRWCTDLLKIKPFEAFVGDDLVYSYVGIRADENRSGYISSKPNIIPVLPFKDDGLEYKDVMQLLDDSGLGLPKYYEWRSRILEEVGGRSQYTVRQPRALSTGAFACLLADYWQRHWPDRSDVLLEQVTQGELARVLLLSENKVNDLLGSLAAPDLALVKRQ